ncbi:hypothetical protein [Nostoc sp.]|uniref:hypothetical protein n=1 Tax=Nostoc sp. TaxID=1180 RepID=UPI0035934A2A
MTYQLGILVICYAEVVDLVVGHSVVMAIATFAAFSSKNEMRRYKSGFDRHHSSLVSQTAI